MDDHMSEVNERLTASCGATLQQLDDIEAKLAGLHEAIERSCGPAHEAWRPGRGGRREARARCHRGVDKSLRRRPPQSISIFASQGDRRWLNQS
jgi:hypothetical protein